MQMLDAMNQVLTPDAVMWAAAAASLVLLASVGLVRSVFTGGRRDATFRMLRIVIILVLVLMVALPLLVLLTGERVSGLPCGCFLLLFPLFCYYFGKGLGYEKGRKSISDLVGLNDADDIEDAQDRLYESRLRIPSRDAVISSIAQLTRPGETNEPVRKPSRNSEVLDVLVEEV